MTNSVYTPLDNPEVLSVLLAILLITGGIVVSIVIGRTIDVIWGPPKCYSSRKSVKSLKIPKNETYGNSRSSVRKRCSSINNRGRRTSR